MSDPDTWPWVPGLKLRAGDHLLIDGQILEVLSITQKKHGYLWVRPLDGQTYNLAVGQKIKYQVKPKKPSF